MERFFRILSYQPSKDFEHIIPELLEQYIFKLTNNIFDTRDDYWILELVVIIGNYHYKLLNEYFDFLYGHWDLINSWILAGNLPMLQWYVKHAKYKQFGLSLIALKEYANAKQNGLKIHQDFLPQITLINHIIIKQ